MNRTADPSVIPPMKTNNMPTKILAGLALLPLNAVTGCLFVESNPPPPPPDPFGDIAFNWSFAGERDCDRAGVDELDIVIFQGGSVFEEIDGEPCVGGGLILTEYLNGRYELEMDAYSRDNVLLYSGGFSVRVLGGVENDVGFVEFEAINAPPPPPPPPPSVGAVGFNWTFLYPANAAIESCAVSGVEEVDVLLVSEFNEEVRDTFNCAATAGATFDNLGEGRWTVHVDGYGRYHNGDVHLYGSTFDVTIVGDELLELNDIALARDEDSFADIAVDWDFTGSSCGVAGITELTVAVQRQGLDTAEDVSTVQCTSLSTTRRTFVPGSYTVTITGNGADAFIGFATVDAAPNTVAPLTIHLAPDPG